MRKPSSFVVETPRLTVRAWQAADRPAFERMVADVAMMRHLTDGKPWPAADVDEFFERQRRHLDGHGVCMGALCRRDDDEVVGVAGIQPLAFDGAYELGWWTWREYWGLGYAPEAGHALVECARSLGLDRVYAVIHPANAPSIRVAEKLGMRFERTASARDTAARRPDIPVLLYALVI